MGLPNDLINKPEPTPQEKYDAIMALRNDVGIYTTTQKEFNDKMTTVLLQQSRTTTLLKWMLLGFILMFAVVCGIGIYFKYLKSKPATVVDKEFISEQTKNLKNRSALLDDQFRDYRRDVQLFRERQRYTDSVQAVKEQEYLKKDSFYEQRRVDIIKQQENAKVLAEAAKVTAERNKEINAQLIKMKEELLKTESFKKNPPQKKYLKTIK